MIESVENLRKLCQEYWDELLTIRSFTILQMLDAIEAEVREEIVRCRDCEWFKEGVVAGKFGKLPNQCLRPTYSGERLELSPEPDDFCSWGSRSDG